MIIGSDAMQVYQLSIHGYEMIIDIVDRHMSIPRMINTKETNKRIFLSEQTLI